jgi:sulfate permease, SulP family
MFLLSIVIGALCVWALNLPAATIGSRFGELPTTLQMPALPEITLARVRELLPSAFTIAFLAGVESLLSAVVADGMTGRRHRSNLELVAQGVANVASSLCGGIPATGAIARTATNIRAGAYSPVAGIMHALFLLLFLLVLAPLASFVPLASLGAVLVVVAWNMAEIKNFRHLMKAPPADRAVLLTTFVLTLLTDLTTAIEIGVVLAALFFMHRMANAVEISAAAKVIDEDVDDFSRERSVYERRTDIPSDVEVFHINGPFFFGAAARLGDVLERLRTPPKAFILRMGNVPLIDASGVAALEKFIDDAARRGTLTVLSNVQPDVESVIKALGLTQKPSVLIAKNLQKALAVVNNPQ